MRYRDLFDAKAWRKYQGRDRRCRLVRVSATSAVLPEVHEVPAQYGSVLTGKQRVWAGLFVRVTLPSGDAILAEDSHSLLKALIGVEAKLNALGWSLDAIGLSSDWQESGLSWNSGYGNHPDVSGAAHMFEPIPNWCSGGRP